MFVIHNSSSSTTYYSCACNLILPCHYIHSHVQAVSNKTYEKWLYLELSWIGIFIKLIKLHYIFMTYDLALLFQ